MNLTNDTAATESLVHTGLTNWSGNLTYSTGNINYPESVTEIQEFVRNSRHIKVLGTRHCFNTIADSKHQLLSTNRLNKVVSFDKQAHTVTVEAGITYGELAPVVHGEGYALHNLASLPHISVAGACATATHGSGVKNQNLGSAVTGLELVQADGNIVEVTKNDGDLFNAAVSSLGALGVITKLTLQLQPAFSMKQFVYERMPMNMAPESFAQVMAAGYSVSLFTDWLSESFTEVWIKDLENSGSAFDTMPEFFGARAASKNLHPILVMPAENCTDQMGVPGCWYERLPHFKMGYTPSTGVELQTEYFVPASQAVNAIAAVSKLKHLIQPLLFISEIRSIAADEQWMSPCHHRDSIAIHFTWQQDWQSVSKVLPQIEHALSPFGARPHWGKLFTMSPALIRQQYEKLDAFKEIVNHLDPTGKFQNDFLTQTLLPPSKASV